MYHVDTETKGILTFDKLPANTYFAMGFNGMITGQAYLFHYDNGTCLAPILKEDNSPLIIPENAGKQIDRKGNLINA